MMHFRNIQTPLSNPDFRKRFAVHFHFTPGPCKRGWWSLEVLCLLAYWVRKYGILCHSELKLSRNRI